MSHLWQKGGRWAVGGAEVQGRGGSGGGEDLRWMEGKGGQGGARQLRVVEEAEDGRGTRGRRMTRRGRGGGKKYL